MQPSASTPGVRVRAALAEYELGELLSAQPLPAGNRASRKITTTQGAFVLKPAYRASDVELQSEVARLLTARGFRQPKVVPTAAGGLVSAAGYVVLEWLPGSAPTDPTPAQVDAAIRHVAGYHVALGQLQLSYQPDPASLWVRVADPAFLVEALPGLLARYELAGNDTGRAIGYLDRFRAGLASLPRQLVHGDVGPDNVLMHGDVVVSLVDFTPHWDNVLFAASTALYWFHVYSSPADVDADRLAASVAAMGERRPWTDAELALWQAGLVREALRRLATALELARETGTDPAPSAISRLEALRAVVRLLPSR
jgi:homoserine kinase type II